MNNPILAADSYKFSHFLQYPAGTTFITSYIEARGFDKNLFKYNEPEVVVAGINVFIRKIVSRQITEADVVEANNLMEAHGEPFNYDGFMKIVNDHDGYWPVRIEVLPEGTVTKPGIPLVQITNTDPELPWVTSFVETMILRAVWYPTTVATISREIKKVITHFLEKTGTPGLIDFKLHDFGARGASSGESAGIGGLAHLINFKGTDTVEALELGYRMYGEVLGFSVPAAEHSTITIWERAGEINAYENMINQFGDGIFSVVSDSYDLHHAVEHIYGEVLKDKINSIKGTLVVRPDSGDPVEITLQTIEMLGRKFGYTINSKGYKVLPNNIRIIQGDGVNLTSIRNILATYLQAGWSADNITFGMGGALLQRLDRDTLKFAMKANEGEVNGKRVPIFKDPVTDHGKKSKRGKQYVYVGTDGKHVATNLPNDVMKNQLQVIYEDGYVTDLMDNTFKTIRERAAV